MRLPHRVMMACEVVPGTQQTRELFRRGPVGDELRPWRCSGVSTGLTITDLGPRVHHIGASGLRSETRHCGDGGMSLSGPGGPWAVHPAVVFPSAVQQGKLAGPSCAVKRSSVQQMSSTHRLAGLPRDRGPGFCLFVHVPSKKAEPDSPPADSARTVQQPMSW